MEANQTELTGICFFFSETGTEGGYWAFQDSKYISPPRPDSTHESWSYKGSHILKNGDRLTIYDKIEPLKIVWSGIIALREYTPFQEHISNCWIHADQEGVKREHWAFYFFKNFPAKLIPAPEKTS